MGAVARARRFVRTDYLPALFAGSTLTDAERKRIAAAMQNVTGIDAAYLLSHDLRLSEHDVADQMLADRGLQLGLYDSRFTLPAKPRGDDPVADDPAMAQYVPAYMAVLNRYFREELKVSLPQDYRGIEWSDVNDRWDYGQGAGKGPNRDFDVDLAVAMRRNPALQLFVGCGYYDLATPLGSAEYTIEHAGIPLTSARFRYYESGHMAYVGEENRHRVADDLRTFVRETSVPKDAPAAL
jgi:carboxypeptidase C (cathepsin A)